MTPCPYSVTNSLSPSLYHQASFKSCPCSVSSTLTPWSMAACANKLLLIRTWMDLLFSLHCFLWYLSSSLLIFLSSKFPSFSDGTLCWFYIRPEDWLHLLCRFSFLSLPFNHYSRLLSGFHPRPFLSFHIIFSSPPSQLHKDWEIPAASSSRLALVLYLCVYWHPCLCVSQALSPVDVHLNLSIPPTPVPHKQNQTCFSSSTFHLSERCCRL